MTEHDYSRVIQIVILNIILIASIFLMIPAGGMLIDSVKELKQLVTTEKEQQEKQLNHSSGWVEINE